MNSPLRWRNRSPGDLSIELDEVSATSVDDAVQVSVRAGAGWARTPQLERAAVLGAVKQKIVDAKTELARGIALETGKPITEALGEVGAVIAKFDLTAVDAQKHLAEQVVTDGPHPARVRYRPRGPAAVVGPFNFPLHLPHGAIVAYLLAGNPVVFKPSPLAAVVGARYAEIVRGVLPPGVFNLVQGGGAEGEALCTHPDVRSVCFTGSIPVGRRLAIALAQDIGKDVALELGGKCATIVLRDADLALSARAVADAMCLTTGQRCNATSRVIVEDAVADEFEQLLMAELERYAPGDPMSPDTKLGPLVSASAVERYARLTALDADRWLKVGQVVPEVGQRRGYYVTPAVACFDTPESAARSTLNLEEAFAPVLTLVRVRDVEQAVEVHDQTPYGLTASVFTRSRHTFEQLIDRLQVGNVYANLPTTFSPSTLPFGGLKSSGNHHPGGRGFIRFASDEQAVQELAGQFDPAG